MTSTCAQYICRACRLQSERFVTNIQTGRLMLFFQVFGTDIARIVYKRYGIYIYYIRNNPSSCCCCCCFIHRIILPLYTVPVCWECWRCIWCFVDVVVVVVVVVVAIRCSPVCRFVNLPFGKRYTQTKTDNGFDVVGVSIVCIFLRSLNTQSYKLYIYIYCRVLWNGWNATARQKSMSTKYIYTEIK